MTTTVAENVPVCFAFASPPSQVDVLMNNKDSIATHVITVSKYRANLVEPRYFFSIAMGSGTNIYEILRTQRVSQFLNSNVISCLCKLVTVQ